MASKKCQFKGCENTAGWPTQFGYSTSQHSVTEAEIYICEEHSSELRKFLASNSIVEEIDRVEDEVELALAAVGSNQMAPDEARRIMAERREVISKANKIVYAWVDKNCNPEIETTWTTERD